MSYSQKIAAAFVKMQEELKNPSNSAYNPISHSKYAPLSDILNFVRPILAKQGLAICQNVGSTEKGKPFVQTILLHESGETMETRELCLDSDSNKRMSTLQEMGSSVTYGKRYQLCAFLGIAPEDDNDGNPLKGQSSGNPQSQSNGKPGKPGNGNKSSDKPNSKPTNNSKSPRNDEPGKSKPTNKPKPNGKPKSKPGEKPKPTTTKTKDGLEITENKGNKPSGEKKKDESIPMETPETNELLLKIKPISVPLYNKFKDIKNKEAITAEMIVKEGQNILGELLSQDQLGLIKEELDV